MDTPVIRVCLRCTRPPVAWRLVLVACCAFVTACAAPVKWGGAALQGTVLADATEEPIEGALVIAYYSSVYVGGQARYTQGYAMTDEQGRFHIPANATIAYAQVGRTPSLLFAHPDFKIVGTYFGERRGLYESNPRLPARGHRPLLESAKRECDHLPSDACLKLLDYASER